MSRFRVLLKPRTVVLFVLMFVVITVALVYAVSTNNPDRNREDSSLPPTPSEMEATQTMDALLATVDKNKLGDDVIAEAQAEGMAYVTVSISSPATPFLTDESQAWADDISSIQDQVLQDISGHNFEVVYQYSHVPALAMYADLATLVALQANVLVTSIRLPQQGQGEPIVSNSIEATQTMDALLATVDKNKLGDDVIAEAQQNGEVWASVKLIDPQDVSFSAETLDEWAASISQIQAQVLQDIEGRNFRDVELLSHVSGMFLKCDLETLIALQSHPLVEKIQIAGEGTQGIVKS